ncbi:TetR/AcrR family transcriptional regulator [Crocosphaera sp. UHCC 0190]|uniref:TetR/AcrR family transcriptional regulator n=1 Tax=Crocosphaera sp. UHCC 0190 TaxID=3110246 RepID=UPI002B1F3798|nr:TetR/AcrR family transcriptional regulator [Crocosphaera sp. UHCC 0190]MEA5509270.1 TetR/AcrR family transcriptional regulator [Crocosphaera sp. UHCC 0190]
MDREKAIIQLIEVFRQHGYEGATLSRLSQATGLGRSSLYHHFPKGKEEIGASVLSYVAERFERMILVPLWNKKEPRERLQQMCQNLREFYCQGQESCLLNAIALGEGNELFKEQIQQAFTTWIEELAQVLIEGGIATEIAYQRAEEGVILIQGALVLARGLNNTKPFERIIENLPDKLLS